MISDNYLNNINHYTPGQFGYADQYEQLTGDLTSFEEQLLLNYEDYLEDNFEILDEYPQEDREDVYEDTDEEE